MMKLIEFFIGTSTLTVAVVYLARVIIKSISEAGIEKYKNELSKETLKFQSNLNKDLEAYKVKFTSLHLEQVTIIKKLYAKIIRAERAYEVLIRPVKVNFNTSENELANDAQEVTIEFVNYFAENEIVFNNETCMIVGKIKDKLMTIWGKYLFKHFAGDSLSGEALIKWANEMHQAYDKTLKHDIRVLKEKLKTDFRKRLGVIDNIYHDNGDPRNID